MLRLQGVSHRSIETQIGKFLREQLGLELKNPRITVNGRRLRCYRLPPLAKCRELYAKHLGQTVDWGEVKKWQHYLDGYVEIANYMRRKT